MAGRTAVLAGLLAVLAVLGPVAGTVGAASAGANGVDGQGTDASVLDAPGQADANATDDVVPASVDAPRGEMTLDRTYGEDDEESFEAVVPVEDGEYVLVGTTGVGESRDARVLQVDGEGDVVYERTLTGPNDDGFGTEGEDVLLGAAVGPRGKVLAVGYSVFRGDREAWVVKLGRELRIQREETFDTGGEATVASDVVPHEDGFALAGWTGEGDVDDAAGPWLALSDREGRVENPRTYAVAGEAGQRVELASGAEDGFGLAVDVTEDDRTTAHLLVVNRSHEVVSRAAFPSGVTTHTDVRGLVRTADGYALAGTQFDVRDGDRVAYLVRTNRRGTVRSRQVFPGEGTTVVAGLANGTGTGAGAGTESGYVLVGRTVEGDGDGELADEDGDAVAIRTDAGVGDPVVTRYGTTTVSAFADVVPAGDRYVAVGSTTVASDGTDGWLVGVPSVARSSFAVARFDAPGRVATGDRYDVAATVSNGGSVEGTRTVAYRVDTDGDGDLEAGETLASESVTLAGGAERRVSFDADATRLFTGEYRHGVVVVDGEDGAAVEDATLVVTDGSDGSGGDDGDGGTAGTDAVSLAWNRTYGETGGSVRAVVPSSSGDGYTLVGSQAARGSVFRVDAEGGLLTRHRFTDADVTVLDATATADGGVVVVGELLPRVDGEPRAVAVRVDRRGDVVWNRTLAGATVATGVVRTSGGYAVSVADTADAPEDYDGALVRLGADGRERSRRTFTDVAVARVAPADDGGLLLAGFVVGDSTLNDTDRDPWAARVSGTGTLAFARSYRHSLDASALDVVDTDAGPVLVGTASSRLGFLDVAVALGLEADGDRRFNATTDAVAGLPSATRGPGGRAVAVSYGGRNGTPVVAFDEAGERSRLHTFDGPASGGAFPAVVEGTGDGYVVGGSFTAESAAAPWAAALAVEDGNGDGDGGDASTRPTVDLSLEPSTVATTPGGTTTVDVVASGLDAGAGGWDLTVRSADPGVARVVGATAGGTPTVDDVQVAGDGSSVAVQAALASAGEDGSGSATLATVTLAGEATGRTALELDVEEVVTTEGANYELGTATNATAVVRDAASPSPVRGAVPTDPDGDGTFEDVNGDGAAGIGDVVVLFDALSEPAVQDHPTAYDFNGDGAVGIGDVVVLFDDVVG